MAVIAIGGVKGGVGKSTYTIMLAKRLAEKENIKIIDGDVANPCCPALFRCEDTRKVEEIFVFRPIFDMARCVRCGQCAKMCKENAILITKQGPLLIEDLCNGCTLCKHVCPYGAIQERKEKIGEIWQGIVDNIELVFARTTSTGPNLPHIARAMRKYVDNPSLPLVAENYLNNENYDLKRTGGLENLSGKGFGEGLAPQSAKPDDETKTTIIDLPAGMHCDVLALLDMADVLRLVVEPTPMGLHDFLIALKLGKRMKKTIEVVINKEGLGMEKEIEKICEREGLTIIERIPYSKELYQQYAKEMMM